ncbi:hypothetical protein DFP73DRAFT_531888 [Morchella snyderi]|nr:hypothetical protein DFP73DRAFT_531888 [Morchella snyderi]
METSGPTHPPIYWHVVIAVVIVVIWCHTHTYYCISCHNAAFPRMGKTVFIRQHYGSYLTPFFGTVCYMYSGQGYGNMADCILLSRRAVPRVNCTITITITTTTTLFTLDYHIVFTWFC